MGEEMIMKLNSIFILMELITLLAYPIVFVQSKLSSFSRSKERIPVANLLIIVPVRQGK
jgi:hypothetical protein